MTRLLPIIAIAIPGFPSISAAEWYAIQGKPTTTIRVKEHGKSAEIPVRKLDLRVTALVLRRDTERAGYYWLEATLPEQRDSGAGYLLAFDDVVLGDIKTRGDKWAIGFDSLDLARRCFQHLRALHKLDEALARDATKG